MVEIKAILKGGEFVALVDGKVVDGVRGYEPLHVIKVASQLIGAILDQMDDTEHNYGILFYACGYDGDAQQRLQEEIEEEFGVFVF